MENTFYWHDYETWGTRPAIDRACQFAGVRTDEKLNIIGEPLVMYCKPPVDILPHPEACLVTGICPIVAEEKGVSEAEFIRCIHNEISRPNTCTVGYNSLRFDDEVTRYALYRNYYDPYEREWRNGNSRWDIIDMVRLVYALRPDGFEWPIVDGKPSFKLENLTAANGLSHASAHDAYSDVEATIAMARLVKEKKPALYNYVLANRSKKDAAKHIDIASRKPLLHISSKFPSERGCCGIVVPLAMHPKNKNAVIVYELSVDPAPLEKLSTIDIRRLIFSKQEDLGEHEQRLPIKLIHLNKCPIMAPVKLLETDIAKRLGIDVEKCEAHWQQIIKMEVAFKVRDVYEDESFATKTDPEQKLYDGFIESEDKTVMTALRAEDPANISNARFYFKDARLNDMLLNYKARNYPDALTSVEKAQWREFVAQRLRDGDTGILSVDAFNACLDTLATNSAMDSKHKAILDSLRQYVSLRERQFLSVSG